MPAMQPERRQLLKAGIWSLPVIAVAAAAPAFASSGSDLRPSSITSANRTGNGSAPTLTVVLRVANGGTSSTTDLTASFNVPSLSATQTTQGGWTVVSVSVATNTVVYRAPSQLDAGSFVTPTFVINRAANGTGSVSVSLDPAGGGIGDSETLTFS